MGYMRHNAIIVSSFDEDKLTDAREAAVRSFRTSEAPISEILESAYNSIYTFMVGPDGSKEGWGPSEDGDNDRQAFVEWLELQRYDDGSSVLDWVEVQYGDDERLTLVVRDSDQRRREATA